MKAMCLLLLCFGFLYAADPDAGPSVAPGVSSPGRADITITEVNTYTVTLGGNPRGCDFADTFDALIVTDYTSDLIYVLNPDNGGIVSTLPCPAGVPDVLGVIFQQTTGGNFIYINNWNAVTDIYVYDETWSSFPNPVGGEPRGMDLDEDSMIWCIDAASRVLYRFNTSGGSVSSVSLTQLPTSYACACAVFPYNGNTGILVGGVHLRQLLLLRVYRKQPDLPRQRPRACCGELLIRCLLQRRPPTPSSGSRKQAAPMPSPSSRSTSMWRSAGTPGPGSRHPSRVKFLTVFPPGQPPGGFHSSRGNA